LDIVLLAVPEGECGFWFLSLGKPGPDIRYKVYNFDGQQRFMF